MMEMPKQGVLFTKNLKQRVDYERIKDVYEFYISYGEPKLIDDYTKVKYKKVSNERLKMTYNQFINYLYTEGYIDEKPNN